MRQIHRLTWRVGEACLKGDRRHRSEDQKNPVNERDDYAAVPSIAGPPTILAFLTLTSVSVSQHKVGMPCQHHHRVCVCVFSSRKFSISVAL
jgi:hypothetical protein